MSNCSNKYPQYSRLPTSTCSGPYFLGATRTYNYISVLKNPTSDKDQWKPWHLSSPEVIDLEQYNVGPGGFSYTNYITATPWPNKVSQYCLGTYARYNLFKNEFVLVPPDQIKLGRYSKLVQDYYHDFTSTLINEYNSRIVKWRDYGWWPYILTPLSLSFWIGGCGEPCYVCTYADPLANLNKNLAFGPAGGPSNSNYTCVGHHEGTLKSVLLSLDRFWLDKAGENSLWPHKDLLVDYYGTVSRGPEPIIGWMAYIMFKKATCSYCHCIIFCIIVQCIDPWFTRYSAVTSIITFNAYQNSNFNAIPQNKPGNFIKFAENTLTEISNIDEYYNIKLDNLAQDEVFVQGVVGYHDAKIYHQNPKVSYTLSKIMSEQTISGAPVSGTQIIKLNKVDGIQVSADTNSSGFHGENGTPSTFFFYGVSGQSTEVGYAIRNVASKHYNHNVRTGIFEYNWLYVDIPDPVPMNVTPTVMSFDGASTPDLYLQDTDPLTIMNKKVYFKTVLQDNGEPALNGTWSQRMPAGSYLQLHKENNQSIPFNQRYYPLVWTDRATFKVVKAPYNLYFKSGTNTFVECALGETLKNLTPGRYYFPNPYACAINSNFGSSSAQSSNQTNPVYEIEEHAKYFETQLPSQFISDGNNDLTNRLANAKNILTDPEIYSQSATPIEEFPRLKLVKVNDVEILDWGDTSLPFYSEWKYTKWNPSKLLDLERKKFLLDFKNYNPSWKPKDIDKYLKL
jgi:hypothetical protein